MKTARLRLALALLIATNMVGYLARPAEAVSGSI